MGRPWGPRETFTPGVDKSTEAGGDLHTAQGITSAVILGADSHLLGIRESDERSYARAEMWNSFSHATHLIQHQSVHNRVKPDGCCECESPGKPFAGNPSLIKHRRVHAGERPSQGNDCGKLSPNSPFGGSECGKAFSRCSDFCCFS